MTGWADDVVSESEEEDGRDGDVLGDVRAVNEREREGTGRGEEGEDNDIPYEQKWETDLEAYQPGKVRSRQGRSLHLTGTVGASVD